MPKNRIILVIGFLLALIFILDGFPEVWERAFGILGGLGIVLLSVLISIDKRLMRKVKAEKRVKKLRETITPSSQEPIPQPENFSPAEDDNDEPTL